eukprot:218537-Pleurochrysis_carterae.AAC.2
MWFGCCLRTLVEYVHEFLLRVVVFARCSRLLAELNAMGCAVKNCVLRGCMLASLSTVKITELKLYIRVETQRMTIIYACCHQAAVSPLHKCMKNVVVVCCCLQHSTGVDIQNKLRTRLAANVIAAAAAGADAARGADAWGWTVNTIPAGVHEGTTVQSVGRQNTRAMNAIGYGSINWARNSIA